MIKEWKCNEHGAFECSDPICPALGCRSQEVVREFRTPPMVRSGMVKQHERGIRELSERMGGANFRTTKEGEASFGGDVGKNLLWGNEAAKFLGDPSQEKNKKSDAMKSGAAVATRVDFSSHDLRPPVNEIIAHRSDGAATKRMVAA